MSREKPESPALDAQDSSTDGLTPIAPDPSVRSRLLAELRSRERWTVWTPSVATLLGIPSADALFALQRIDDASAWQPGLWPNSRVMHTPKLQEVRAVIASVPAGTQIARHTHAQRELTYVLDGELIEDDLRRYGSGELLELAAGTEHRLTVGGTSDCLVVFFLPRS